ncbi:rhodanese-like domain-containing protein [Paenibacillus montanisoli]|uniref:Rhodanese-like domain-containing protein n=1 Tax=Paenibacillus montanisoli TaxID=2081970 RepID=A0A328U1B0_9BACL|nr:rhodanese-like domain-containing protein [Paenibacillus montanisoli]RAP76420.1 rhodanese-like domain-containing protein [Paenibacillus montanisoli]
MERWSNIEPEPFLALVREGKLALDQIIDVRELDEWNYYHLDNSTLMPLSSFQERENEIERERPVYVICAHGVRSVAVCRYLSEKGYGNLANVIGGMAAVSSLDGFQYD